MTEATTIATQEDTLRLAPALPLIVNDPYMSVWFAGDDPTRNWPEHWSGRELPFLVMVRVDGEPYVAMGMVENGKPLHLKKNILSACETAYVYEGGGVEFQVKFVTPKDPGDLLTLSIPLSIVELGARALDGRKHSIDWLVGITGDWAPGKSNEEIRAVPISLGDSGAWAVEGFSLEAAEPSAFEEERDWPLWGTTAFISLGVPRGETAFSGSRQYYLHGEMKRLQQAFVRDNWAGVAAPSPIGLLFGDSTVTGRSDAFGIGLMGIGISGARAANLRLALGNIYPVAAAMKDATSSLGVARMSYVWTSYFSDEKELLQYVARNQDGLLNVAAATDKKVVKLSEALGEGFRFLAELVFRQTLGGYVLVTDGKGNLMLGKEMSSGGYIQTVDVIFPASPFFLVLNPELLKMQLEPVFRYVESGEWLETFAPHDLGHYPRAMGQAYPKPMPLEESGNIVLLAAAVWKETQDVDFIRRHYATLRVWAEYLAEHGESPEEQLFTDDFTGPSANNAHLSLKALLGVAAFARLAEAVGESGDARQFAERARAMKESWLFRAWAKDHFVRVFGEPGSWSLPYNLLFDEYLGLDVVPREFVEAELEFLLDRRENYGIPLEERFKYTKADWLMWLVALSRDPVQRETIMEGILRMLRESPDRVPFTDWYETQDARNRGFRARSVMGGVYAAVLMCQKR